MCITNFKNLLQDCHPALRDVIPLWKHVHHYFWGLHQDCHPALGYVIPQCWIWTQNWNQHHWFGMEVCASLISRFAPGLPSSRSIFASHPGSLCSNGIFLSVIPSVRWIGSHSFIIKSGIVIRKGSIVKNFYLAMTKLERRIYWS